jgi:hypothetical protein
VETLIQCGVDFNRTVDGKLCHELDDKIDEACSVVQKHLRADIETN